MDAIFWVMVAVTATSLVGVLMQERRLSRLTDSFDALADRHDLQRHALTTAERLIASRDATISRLTEEAKHRHARGAGGRFTRREGARTKPPGPWVTDPNVGPPPAVGPSSA